MSIIKTLPQKGLVENGKKGRCGKQSKKRCTVALFVAANGSKACDPIVVWRSKKPRCFKKLKNIYRPHGSSIIKNFKNKYRRMLIRYILARIDSVSRTSTEIIKDVTILKVTELIQISWTDVGEKTIKNSSEQGGFGNPNNVAGETIDHEFEELLQELSSDVTVEEFLEFHDCVNTCEPEVNIPSVDCREELRAIKCIQLFTNQNVKLDDNCSES